MEVKLTEHCVVDPICDPMLNQLSGGESENDPLIKPISFEEIYKYYDCQVDEQDKDVRQSVLDFKKKTIQRTLDKINKSLPVITKNWPKASPIEIYIGFKISCSDPEELICSVSKEKFLTKVRDEISRLSKSKSNESESSSSSEAAQEEEEDDTDGDYRAVDVPAQTEIRHHKKHVRKEKRNTPKYPKPKEIPADTWLSWSDAKQLSYLRSGNPNTFLYRNLPPGETKRNGPWSQDEKKLFLRRLKEMKEQTEGPISQWGIFSQAIPGRVGYQCANFYRKLVQSGEIKDENYIIDKEGVLRYTNRVTHQVKVVSEPSESKYDQMAKQSPLLGMIDSITQEEIKVPALSPSGYVLDYNTWINIMKTSKLDPFTQTPINKRQLIILTKENIDENRDKIKNLN